MLRHRVHCLTIVIALVLTSVSVNATTPVRRTWNVGGVTREALVAVPATALTVAAPIVFAFHQHGDSMTGASLMYRYHTIWPEAIVVYMQGLKTPGQFIDPHGFYTGWQRFKGDQNDRDLYFFDAVVSSLILDYKVDLLRIYSSGHSNGANFTYLLWAERESVFAAMAPSAGVATGFESKLKAKPLFHAAAFNDPIINYTLQNATINAVKTLNQCAVIGSPWEITCTQFPSASGNPVITLLGYHGHSFPSTASALIVKFFKAWSKPVPPITARVQFITASSTIQNRQPEISWQPLSGAAKYDIWINNMTTGQAQVIRDVNVSGTSFIPAAPLDYGTYHIWVRGVNAAGLPGPWPGRLQLIIVPPPVSGAVEFTTNSGTTTDQTPRISWSSVPGADHYDIWIDNVTTGQQQVIRDVNVSGTSFTVSAPLSYGTWHIWARGINAIGASGPWSARLQLEIVSQ